MQAVSDVSLSIGDGETLGLVGESGSGKSTIARAVVGVDPTTKGAVRILDARGDAVSRGTKPFARAAQMIFQDPRASLDPKQSVAAAIGEALDIHGIGLRADRQNRVFELIELVGLSPELAPSLPRELSGGQLQRVAIARALAVEPRLLLCDEAVSALDVSVQAQIVNLLRSLQDRLGISMLFIAHDLAVVRNIAHRIAVMYLGRVVEIGDSDTLVARPAHPYTRALLDAVPRIEPSSQERTLLTGDLPSPLSPPSGCSFRTRCRWATELCTTTRPELRQSPGNSGLVACHHAEEIAAAES